MALEDQKTMNYFRRRCTWNIQISAGLIRRSQVTGHRSQVTGHRSQVTGHRSQVAGHRSQVAGRRSQVTGHRSQVAGSGYNHYFMLSSREKQKNSLLFKTRFAHIRLSSSNKQFVFNSCLQHLKF